MSDALSTQPLAGHIVQLLADVGTTGMSLPRLCKQLGLRASVVMRHLSALGPGVLGGVQGPGWVQLSLDGHHWKAALTDTGRQALAAWAAQQSAIGVDGCAEKAHAGSR